MDHSKHVACVVEHGLFLSLAELIAPHFAKVYYATPTAKAFETTAEHSIGTGIENVERLADTTSILKLRDKIDLFIFPDVGFQDLAVHLRELGHRVWSAGLAEKLEMDREAFKAHCDRLGIDTPAYEIVKGATAAQEFHKAHPGWFVKTSALEKPPYRGDFETIRSKSWRHVRYRWAEIASILGAKAESADFLFEKPVPDAAEIAWDSPCVDGEFPDVGIKGIEIKAESYLGHVAPYSECPAQIVRQNEQLAPTFKRAKYRGMFALESRFVKKGAMALDPCCRFGRPPLSIQAIYSNWPDILWDVAGGEIPVMKPVGRYAAEMCLYSDYAEEHPVPFVGLPDDLVPHLKLSNYCIERGERTVLPTVGKMSGIGSVVAVGPTMRAAIEKVREVAKEIETCAWDVKASDAFDHADKQIEILKTLGIAF